MDADKRRLDACDGLLRRGADRIDIVGRQDRWTRAVAASSMASAARTPLARARLRRETTDERTRAAARFGMRPIEAQSDR